MNLHSKKVSLLWIRQLGNLLPFNLFVWALLLLYLSPVFFMIVTAMKSTEQLSDRNAPLYPATRVPYEYQGRKYHLYHVPTTDGVKQWAMINPGREMTEFIDPQRPEAGLIQWEGNWRSLKGVYKFHIAWANFNVLFKSLLFPRMLTNTFLMTLIGGIAILASSIIVAYGFSRFSLPGGDLLFYVLIATILIPEKVTFIPSYFVYVNYLHWRGTFLPILLPLFFGNAVYIFLLRQNFRNIPVDLEEAAMLDGAGPLQRLWYVILPQSWPVVITVSLLFFFYSWNEIRQVSLYVGSNMQLIPLSYGVQNFQSFNPVQNLIAASTIVVLAFPVILLFLSQRFFMQGLVITGTENNT
ncbi:MAG TPA: carbohydrate ABC transporter permease [Anaerolineales bacterium]|nr:carbohydrate ABC transporter permease [Anaerolineales bacterium]